MLLIHLALKKKKKDDTGEKGTKNLEIVVSSKYLGNF